MSALVVLIVSAGTEVLSLSLSASEGELQPKIEVARTIKIAAVTAVLFMKSI